MKYLPEFSRAVLDNLSGASSGTWFEKRYGLCSNYRRYLDVVCGLSASEAEHHLDLIVDHEFGGCEFPFNDGEHEGYYSECDSLTVYENPKRLAFLNKWSSKHP